MTLKTFAALATAISLSACVSGEGGSTGGGSTPPPDPFRQTINFVSQNGPLAIDQSFAGGAGSPGNSRICFVNNTGEQATLMHDAAGINPMNAAPGGQSCANFNPAARVNFTLVQTTGFLPMPAQPDRNFVYNMSGFENGLLTLALRSNR